MTLQKENGILKDMLLYQPGGDGAKECQQHFETLCNKEKFE